MSESSNLTASVVQGNKPLRFFALMIMLILIVAHFLGTVNLLEPSILWVMVLMSLNALQASFTGFCPMFKDKDGNCVACGVQCSSSTTSSSKTEATGGGCCDSNNDVSKESGCCGSDEKQKPSKGCCSSDDTDESKCCGTVECVSIKVLGTGCKTCDNTVKLIEQTAQEIGVTVYISKVDDVADIASYGVMSTPGIVIKEQVLHSGGMPTKDQVKSWLLENT